MRGRLKGAIVMTQPMMTTFIREDRINPTAPNAPPTCTPLQAGSAADGRRGRGGGGRGGASEAQRIAQILHDAGVGAVLKPSRGEHGTIFLQTRDAGANGVPTVVVAGEDYNNLIRLLEDRVPVTRARQRSGPLFHAGHQRLQHHRRDSRHRSTPAKTKW